MKTPHTYLILPLLCLFLLFAPLTAAATAQASGSVRQANAATEVTLYDMDSSYAEVVSVPSSMSRSYRIPQGDAATYRVTSPFYYLLLILIKSNSSHTFKQFYDYFMLTP